MVDFLNIQSQKLFGKTFKIGFYSEIDDSDAHHNSAGSALEFNILGSTFAKFCSMLENRKFDLNYYLDVMAVFTHEIVHSTEKKGEPTHDKPFYQPHLQCAIHSFGVTGS